MRAFIAIIVGLIGGFFLGIALSSFIGIFGMLAFDQAMGIKFLPYFTAIICAVLIPIIDHKSKK
ncbi:DUF5957 family protein [Ornithinibacillus salinisoli]|uniref:DUF5957 family protein n=1 Tax=Ornithinibacillus salinisoli TaxID=1848459 RepID=A0ABW4VXC6_9BACI